MQNLELFWCSSGIARTPLDPDLSDNCWTVWPQVPFICNTVATSVSANGYECVCGTDWTSNGATCLHDNLCADAPCGVPP